MGGVIGQAPGVDTTAFRSRAKGVGNADRPVGKSRNRLVSVNVGVKNLPRGSQLAQKPLSARVVEVAKPTVLVTQQSGSSSGVMTRAELTEIAGQPKEGKNQSPTYKALLAELDNCQNTSKGGLVEHMSALNKAEEAAVTFVGKKAKEAKKGAAENPRFSGGVKALDSIKAEQRATVDKIVDVFTKGAELTSTVEDIQAVSDLAGDIAVLDTEQQASLIASLPQSIKDNVVKSVIGQLVDKHEDPNKAVDVLMSLLNVHAEDSAMISQNMGKPLAFGGPDQTAMTASKVASLGKLTLPMVAALSTANGQLLGGEMATRQDAQEWVASIDEDLCRELNVFQAVQANGPLGTVDDFPEFPADPNKSKEVQEKEDEAKKSFMQAVGFQHVAITADRLLRVASTNKQPELAAMLKGWDQLLFKSVEDYVASTPAEVKAAKALDIDNAFFSDQLSKLDINHFKKTLKKGKTVSAASLGWTPLPENWQNNPNTKPTPKQIILDFLARNAPGVGLP